MTDWKELSPYFSKEEIFSPETIRFLFLLDIPSLIKLNGFRAYLGRSLVVNFDKHRLRGVRSPKEQLSLVAAGLTTAENSQHVQGKAFDISSPGFSVEELADAASDFGWHGIGIYRSANFVHVDNRSNELLPSNIYWEHV